MQRDNPHFSGKNTMSLSSPSNNSIRETGLISKIMQASFGFITCCERNESIFFHFSQYNGDPNDLQTGDEVEFEVSTDPEKGKLIARRLVLLPSGTVSFESVGEERLLGKVDVEPQLVRTSEPDIHRGGSRRNMGEFRDPGLGRIIYERQGEFFFIPYGFTDVNDDREIHHGDEVSFYMATNKRTGALRARLVRLVQPAKVEKIRGLVKSFKETFGFIERADIVGDIFFHYSEVDPGEQTKLILGASVEFVIQNRQGKKVATHVKVLPHGSVSFDDVSNEIHEGVVRTPVKRSFTHGRGKELESTPGEIIYQPDLGGGPVMQYTERDQDGSYTMLSGDIVRFKIAADKRDGSRRATGVVLHKLVESQEGHVTREKGMIVALRDGFGFIRCAKRDLRMFFHFNEVIDSEAQLTSTTEVEFTVQKDYTNERLHAVRIVILPMNTVQFETKFTSLYHGCVQEELSSEGGRNKPNILKLQKDAPHGLIQYEDKEGVAYIPFYWSSEYLQFGDQVEFYIARRSYDELVYAVEVNITQKANEMRFQGFVSVLKEGFGFIETEEHDCELFFPFSSCNKYCDPRDLKLMDEVDYCLVRKNGRLSADEIKLLEKGTIAAETINPGSYEGVVLRQMKNSDNADEYEGLIKPNSPVPGIKDNIPYSFTGLTNYQIQLQAGETVEFQVGVSQITGTLRAVNIISKRGLLRGHIESVKDQFGFITYKGKETTPQSVFFHMNSLAGGCGFDELQSGDEVEFMTVYSHKAKKDSAIYVKKLSSSVRPERLSRHGSLHKAGTLITVIRQPKGPNGTKGFSGNL